MTLNNQDSSFDERYYSAAFGVPYGRDPERQRRTEALADAIVATLAPRTTLDVGSGFGQLVAALRARGVDAHGLELSAYALEQTPTDVRPFCDEGSLLAPLSGRFDLVTCLDVLPLLNVEDRVTAVTHLTAAADTLLISWSSEGNGIVPKQVEESEVWASLFAAHDFVPVVDSVLPLGPRFLHLRRFSGSLAEVVGPYERHRRHDALETVALRAAAVLDTRAWQVELTKRQERIVSLRDQLRESGLAGQQLDEIEGRLSWQLLQRLWHWQVRVFPPGSPREMVWIRFTNLARRLLKVRAPAPPAPTGTPTTGPTPYQRWREEHEVLPEELEQQRGRASALPYRPLISIITPVFNPPVEILSAAIDSVLAQSYDRWELCLADASDDSQVHSVLREYAAADPRINLRFLTENGGIGLNANQAADLATGEFLQILDHDDLLAPNALYEAVQVLQDQRDADVLYYDEDKISADGDRHEDPFFKPDWSPEMLLSVNYLMHGMVRRSVFEDAGRFQAGTQDWDLMLRVTERTNRIVHVPLVLYHWRKSAGSTAGIHSAKPEVYDRQLVSISAHLERLGRPQPTAQFAAPGILRVSWPVSGRLVSIVIPSRDKVELLRPCVNFVLNMTRYPNFEVVIVDTGSHEEATETYYRSLEGDPRVRITRFLEPFNYSAANNFGARKTTGDILVFLNNDVEVLEPDWLEELVRWAECPEIGVVGAKLLYADGRIQHAGVVLGMEGHASHVFRGLRENATGLFGSVNWYRNYLAVTGACMAMRRTVFDEVGGFDEGYQLVFSDVDICLQAVARGYRNLYTPFARLRHHEGGSRARRIPPQDKEYAYRRMLDVVRAGDPAYNPNLSYAAAIPGPRRPDEEDRVARVRRLSAAR